MEILDSRTSVGSCDLQTGVMVEGNLYKHIVFREMAGPEEDLLANKKMSVSRKFTNLMANCIRKFGDVEDRAEINKLVEKMVETDRIFFLIQLRRLSVSDNIEFKTTCPECGSEDKVIYNLDGIAIINPPKAEALFSEFTLPSGVKLRIKAADAKVEADIEKAANDPWKRPYQYLRPGQHGEFDIYSLGADGKPGGEGDDADIGNWDTK